MISYLEGTIKLKSINYLILLTGGVGYKVFCPKDWLDNLKENTEAQIFTFTNVRDDAIELFGFQTSSDLTLFELFLSVPGVGPRLALSIFSNGKSDKIREAIIKGDIEYFTSIPRLGRKNAQKIIIELKNKLGGDNALIDLSENRGETKEIMDALKAFGFSPAETRDALKEIGNIEGNTSSKVKAALKYLDK